VKAVDSCAKGSPVSDPLITHHETLDKTRAFSMQLRKNESIKVLVDPE